MGCGSAKVAVEPFEKPAATEPKEASSGSLDPFILQCLEAGYRTLSRTEAQAQLNSGLVPEEDDFGDDEDDYNETEPGGISTCHLTNVTSLKIAWKPFAPQRGCNMLL